MAKDNKIIWVLGGLLAFFAFKPKANASTNKITTSNANSGGGTSSTNSNVGKENVSITPSEIAQGTLVGVQNVLDIIPNPSNLEKDTQAETAKNINWNFGFIAKTSKRWFGEVVSTSPVKTFINRFAGLGAMMYLLWVYINNKKLNTIRSIGNSWASRNKEIWINKVSEYSGLQPDETLEADSSYLFKLAYAISLYYQPLAKNYISSNTLIVALEYMSRNYKIKVE